MKKKILSLTVILGMLLLAFAGCAPSNIKEPSNYALNLEGMELVFNDEFDNQQAYESNWTDKKYWDSDPDNIRRGAYWDKEQCFLENGNLIIRTEKKVGKYGEAWYTGMLNTRGISQYKYGYFEIKCKAPKAEGLWSAFWMLSDTYSNVTGDGRGGAEIDIMESPYYNDYELPAKYYRNTTFHTVHIDGYGDDHSSVTSPKYKVQKDMYDEFNTYGVLWTAGGYEFYINGKRTYTTSFGVSDSNQYIILSVEVSGEHNRTAPNPSNPKNKYSWGGEIENNPKELMPADFVIDYVKIYQ